MSHTPTPWDRDEGDFTIYSLEDSSEIASMTSDDAVLDDANAAFIVRACNSFDDLVAALARCEAMVSTDQGPPNWDWIRSVLKNARGETP